MNETRIKNVLAMNGWKADRYGNLLSKSKATRVHFQANSCRVERNHPAYIDSYGCKVGSSWSPIVSDYYKNVSFNEAGMPVIKGRALKVL